MLAPNKLRSAIFGNRGFATPSAAGGATLAFHALAGNESNVFTGVLTGTGSLTSTHTSTLYAAESDGTYNSFTTNKAVVSGGTYTDEDTVSDTGSTYLQYYPAATNSQLYSNDLTNAEWTATTMTVAKDETGVDGSANGACTLTATGANSTVIANAITAASATHATSFFIKRKTGTGTVELTVDGGTTWQSITLTSSFQRLTVDQATVTNPVVGIRIVTSADAVIVGNAECHLTKTIAEVRGLGPIFTTTAAVSTDAPVYTFDLANDDNTKSAGYVEVDMSAGGGISGSAASQYFITANTTTVNDAAYLAMVNTTALKLRWWNGSGETAATFANKFNGTPKTAKLAYVFDTSDGSASVNIDGAYSADGVATCCAQTSGGIRLGAAFDESIKFRNLRRYTITSYQQGKDKIDELMA